MKVQIFLTEQYKDILADLSVIWNYGRNEEEISRSNPFEKHGVKVKATRKPYLAWDIDDLRKVVATMKDERDKLDGLSGMVHR